MVYSIQEKFNFVFTEYQIEDHVKNRKKMLWVLFLFRVYIGFFFNFQYLLFTSLFTFFFQNLLDLIIFFSTFLFHSFKSNPISFPLYLNVQTFHAHLILYPIFYYLIPFHNSTFVYKSLYFLHLLSPTSQFSYLYINNYTRMDFVFLLLIALIFISFLIS